MGEVIPIRGGIAPSREPYMKKAQAAVYLAVSTRTVEEWGRHHGLPFRQVRGVNLYRASELDAWVNEQAAR